MDGGLNSGEAKREGKTSRTSHQLERRTALLKQQQAVPLATPLFQQ